jgi:hypothetical protein
MSAKNKQGNLIVDDVENEVDDVEAEEAEEVSSTRGITAPKAAQLPVVALRKSKKIRRMRVLLAASPRLSAAWLNTGKVSVLKCRRSSGRLVKKPNGWRPSSWL